MVKRMGQCSASSFRPAASRSGGPETRPRLDGSDEKPKKLGYREQREWDEMEGRILEAEARLQACELAVEDPVVASDHQALADRLRALAEAQAEIERLYSRWAQLESRLKG